MTLTEIEKSSKQFKDTHSVSVSGFNDNGQRITAAYVLTVTTKLINDLTKIVKDGFAQVNARIDRLEARIDNLVAKNNLKE